MGDSLRGCDAGEDEDSTSALAEELTYKSGEIPESPSRVEQENDDDNDDDDEEEEGEEEEDNEGEEEEEEEEEFDDDALSVA